MVDSIEFMQILMWTLIPSVLYAIVLWGFDPQSPKLLPMALLFLIGTLLVIPCYIVEYAMDMALPWGSSGHLILNMLPTAILEEGAKLLCLGFAFRVFLGKHERWQYFLTSGFVLGSGFMFMETFACMVEYGDVYMVQDNKTYLVELTDPLFGGITGIGLFLILKGKRLQSLLFILPPGTLHFCHNAGVIVLGDIPWWPAYFAVYILALLFFTCEHICMNLGKINES
jgi:RsiW-degrading membrane proteinase PrsW (M82 family)